MTGELSLEERRYLQSAFALSPREWFRPGTIETSQFSDREIDKIVESLARQGLIDAQPDCHARLTDQGRKQATNLERMAQRDWKAFARRKRVRLVVGAAAIVLTAVVVALKLAGVV